MYVGNSYIGGSGSNFHHGEMKFWHGVSKAHMQWHNKPAFPFPLSDHVAIWYRSIMDQRIRQEARLHIGLRSQVHWKKSFSTKRAGLHGIPAAILMQLLSTHRVLDKTRFR